MLLDYKGPERDPISDIMADLGGGQPGMRTIKQGFYELGHFNFDNLLETVHKIERWPEVKGLENSYGVCDSPEQFIKRYEKILKASKRTFVVSFCCVEKKNQPSQGGWRWHKWGPYIGTKKPKCEYLYNEGPSIEKVYGFHVLEIMG
jgi:hypothetical protein